jgi:sigma-E factor negative regulatory protein RseB
MSSKSLHLAAALVLALLTVKASLPEPASDARQWLERMIQVAHTLSYDGIFVYIQGQQLEAMHVIHQGDAERERQRLFSLNGSPREIVVAGNQVICVVPEHQAMLGTSYRRSPFPLLPRKLDELEGNYEFRLLGEDRVAGMNTRVIAIQPRDKLRFGYRLWLEPETGMVLRSALSDEAGHILEQMMFTNVQFKREIDPALLAPPPSAAPAAPAVSPELQASPEKAVHSAWTLAESELPRGFTGVMHNQLTADSGKPPAEHIVLTDGLATVSVFLEPLAGAKPLLEGPAQMGAMNAFGVVNNDYQILVVGEVPQATVQMIAFAVHAAPEAVAK